MYTLSAGPSTNSGMAVKRKFLGIKNRSNLFWVSCNHKLTSCSPENGVKF
ncbi:unnamed protein product, partial [Rotaria sp. Silwood2]